MFAVAAALLFLAARLHSFAGSATWQANPSSGDWNAAANWMPNTVPNGQSDIATFGRSTVTNLSMNATSVEFSNMVFRQGASPFTFTIDSSNGGVNLDITGSGIVNNSGAVQSFYAGQNFQVSYEGGDGNDLTLTVVPQRGYLKRRAPS